MDTGRLVGATPFLRREVMFNYKRSGSYKRTIIYAAREGHSLASARGITTELAE